ncbi:MAG: hypothetical protein RRY40_00960 [Oscillospiraceae bacterium]
MFGNNNNNSSNNSNNGKSMDSLLNYAGKKMGCSPEEIKKSLESGNFDSLNMSAAQKKQVGEILKDKEALNKILTDPGVQNLINSITRGK